MAGLQCEHLWTLPAMLPEVVKQQQMRNNWNTSLSSLTHSTHTCISSMAKPFRMCSIWAILMTWKKLISSISSITVIPLTWVSSSSSSRSITTSIIFIISPGVNLSGSHSESLATSTRQPSLLRPGSTLIMPLLIVAWAAWGVSSPSNGACLWRYLW